MASNPYLTGWRMNQPIWFMDTIPAYFHTWYQDRIVDLPMMRIGFVIGGQGRWAVVPAEWVTEREEDS